MRVSICWMNSDLLDKLTGKGRGSSDREGISAGAIVCATRQGDQGRGYVRSGIQDDKENLRGMSYHITGSGITGITTKHAWLIVG